jgi:cation diffusion facilitator CzcD-associated flavoprotein CzcO
MSTERHHHVGIVGAGIAGVGVGKRLLDAGTADFVIWERNNSVGGTWFEHTYPGCACDIPTHLYSYAFQRNPNWTRLFPRQEEILRYVRDTAEQFAITDHIHFECEMLKSTWDDQASRWRVETTDGVFTCNVLISAIGATAEPDEPDIPGLEGFRGHRFHSARWDHDHDLSGKRVAVIGTGPAAEDSASRRKAHCLPAHAAVGRPPPGPARSVARAPSLQAPAAHAGCPAQSALRDLRGDRCRLSRSEMDHRPNRSPRARTPAASGARCGTARQAHAELPIWLQASHPVQ